MYVFGALSALGNGAYYAVDTALMADVLPSDDTHGKDLGILGMANGIGQMAGPAASSVIIGIGVGFVPVFGVAFALCVIGAICTVPIKSVR
jgi:MFS family permease